MPVPIDTITGQVPYPVEQAIRRLASASNRLEVHIESVSSQLSKAVATIPAPLDMQAVIDAVQKALQPTGSNPLTTAASAVPSQLGTTGQFLGVPSAGQPAVYRPVTDALLVLSDILTNDVSVLRHGFMPKLTGDPSQFLDETGVARDPYRIVSITFADSPYTLTDLGSNVLVLVNATGGAVTVKLPVLPTTRVRVVTVKKTDATGNAVTINGNGVNIDGLATQPLAAQYDSLTQETNQVQWWITGGV